MKFSSLQIIAIACIIATGFLTVAPFSQDALAWGPSHSYQVGLDTTLFLYCVHCNTWNSYHLGVRMYTLTHLDDEAHILGGTYYIYSTTTSCGGCTA